MSSLRGGPPRRVPRDFHLHVGRVPKHAVERVAGRSSDSAGSHVSRVESARASSENRDAFSRSRGQSISFGHWFGPRSRACRCASVAIGRVSSSTPNSTCSRKSGSPAVFSAPSRTYPGAGVSVIHGVLLLLRHREEPSRRRQRVAPRRRRDEGVDAGDVEEPDGVAHLAQLGRERRLRRARAPRRGAASARGGWKTPDARAAPGDSDDIARARAGGRRGERARLGGGTRPRGHVGDADIPHARWRVRAKTRIKTSRCGRRAGVVFSRLRGERITRSLFSRSRLGRPLLSPAASTRRVGLFPTRACFRDGVTTRGARGSVRVAASFPVERHVGHRRERRQGNPRRSASCGGFRSPKRLRPGRSRACGTCPAVRRSNGVVEVRSGEVGADDGVEKRRSLAKAPLVSEVFQQKKTTRVGS